MPQWIFLSKCCLLLCSAIKKCMHQLEEGFLALHNNLDLLDFRVKKWKNLDIICRATIASLFSKLYHPQLVLGLWEVFATHWQDNYPSCFSGFWLLCHKTRQKTEVQYLQTISEASNWFVQRISELNNFIKQRMLLLVVVPQSYCS